MDLAKVLAQLHAELENIDAAIESLERIRQGSKRRGRPPAALAKTRTAKSRGASLEAGDAAEEQYRPPRSR
ncbi:MAG TPA: hypothetical protein VHW24_13650 [Bryobacteraceae bacterium]|jgi:hypothetical protein|nr:hypothetical protein [Bryobacteraceae bacterium]